MRIPSLLSSAKRSEKGVRKKKGMASGTVSVVVR